MHILIKDNYFNLDDILIVSVIEGVGCEGAKFFTATCKNLKTIEFFYSPSYQQDVYISNGNFFFGTDVFFFNAHKEIINKLTNAA